jgi:putative salt-induced outer membrane protein YdiY
MIKIFHSAAFTLFLILIPATQAFSQCDPKEDSCAPKKEPGAWDKSLAFGLNVTSGNSETTVANIASKFAKDFEGEIWDFGLAYNYGEDKAREDSGEDKTNRNDLRGNASYNHMLNDNVFVGFGTKFLYDEIADVDYRVGLDPTAGYYFIKDNTYKFRLEAGPSYIFEKVGSVSDDYLAPRIADRFDWAISCTSKIYQTAEVLFDINDSDNYLVNAEIGVEAALNSTLSLVFTVRETFDNQPAPDREKDDLAIITALKVAI